MEGDGKSTTGVNEGEAGEVTLEVRASRVEEEGGESSGMDGIVGSTVVGISVEQLTDAGGNGSVTKSCELRRKDAMGEEQRLGATASGETRTAVTGSAGGGVVRTTNEGKDDE